MGTFEWNPRSSDLAAFIWAAGALVVILVAFHFWSTSKKERKEKRYKVGMWGLVVGDDGRTSTSKVQFFLWTLTFFWALIVLLCIGIDKFEQTFETEFQAEYLVLLGSPAAAAVIAKYITRNRVDEGEQVKPEPERQTIGNLLGDVVSDDQHKGDLADFQYLMFNVIALVFFYTKFVEEPTSGLPSIPPTLVALTGVSALAYVAKKNTERTIPHLLTVTPEAGAPGEMIILRGSNLVGSDEKRKVDVMVKFGELRATPRPDDIRSTATGDEVKVAVPANASPAKVTIRVVTPHGPETQEERTFNILSPTETQHPQIARVLPEEVLQVRPGAQLTIIGAGFVADGDSTNKAGRVTLDGLQLEIDPKRWTTTQLDVQLPSETKLRNSGLVPGQGKLIVYDTKNRPSTPFNLTLAMPVAGLLAVDQPAVTTTKAAELRDDKVTFFGTVNPKGRMTHFYFRYGPQKDNYPGGTRMESAGSGPAAVEVRAQISLSDLPKRSAGALYHYQLVATNEAGTTYGDDTQFPTP